MEPVSFKTDAELIEYVEGQVGLVLPPDWKIGRISGERVAWSIRPPGQTLKDYILYVSDDRRDFVFLYDNTDEGPRGLNHALLNAKVFDVGALQWCPLSRAIKHVVETCKLNRWGLT